jgi:hypothetical protein
MTPELIQAQTYGWGVVYALTVEGIDCVFVERATGLTLPGSGPFTQSQEDASLVIDTSGPVGSQIDRSQGIGTGLSLGFALLDTATVRANLLAPQYTARLAADLSATATTITVDDTTGWPAAGVLFAGVERITYTGTTATTFTGCTRGTLGKAFAHAQGSSSSVLTSSPRWWAGREATLWAVAVDPAGQVAGSTFGDVGNVLCLWRGYIEAGPQRIPQGFRFEASALDRRLARPLQAEATGKIVSTQARYEVDPTQVYAFVIERYAGGTQQWAHAIQFSPFSTLSTGTRYPGAQLRALVVSGFASALAALGAPATTRIDGFKWIPIDADGPAFKAAIQLPAQTSGDQFIVTNAGAQSLPAQAPYAITDLPQQLGTKPVLLDCQYTIRDTPTEGIKAAQNGIRGLTIELDDGAPDVIQAPVTVKIELAQDTSGYVTAAHVSSAGGLLYLGTFTAADAAAQAATDVVGKTAAVQYVAQGSPADVLLKHLHSSGTAALRDGTYDTLPRAQGYGLETSRVDQSSTALLSQGPVSSLTLDTTTGPRSVVDLFAGLLALSRLAIVARPDTSDDYRQIKLAVVSTALNNSGAVVNISDADLLSLESSPVEVLDRQTPQTLIKLQLDSGQSITYTDVPAVDTLGTVSQEWKIPHNDRDTIYSIATPLVASYFATQPTIQTIKLRVSQAVDAHVGDVVNLNITHPSIYDWASGVIGYNGTAVVLGRSLDLRSKAVELVVAASAQLSGRALAPSAEVTAYSIGVSVTVARGWYQHFAHTHEVDGDFDVTVYQPGNAETTAQGFTIDGVTDTGSACVLSISATHGAPTVTVGGVNPSRLTLPTFGTATEYQSGFAYTDQGGFWL